ncbi:hypothetical protein [Pricia sp.]|uniref:hypothetical protein n=1 Tax=Pricia sp. TaxID=2268138 RepID=UPI00359448F5
MLLRPLSPSHFEFLESKRPCSLRAPPWPSLFKVAEIAFSLMPFPSFSRAFTSPSPLKFAILFMRAIPLREAMTIQVSTWSAPNFVALCHRVGNPLPIIPTRPCPFMNFMMGFSPEYLVMLPPVKEFFRTCAFPFSFFFVFFILKVMFFIAGLML